MKIIFQICLVVFFASSISAQNLVGKVSASFYTFERYETINESSSFIRSFENLSLRYNNKNFHVVSRFNFESNLSDKLVDDPRIRFYNLYVQADKLFEIATLKLGRQSYFAGIASGLYDGINLKLKAHNFSLTSFYGGNVPAYQKLEITDNWSENYILGGKLKYKPNDQFNFALSYVDKNYQRDSYSTSRLDSAFRPITILIEKNSSQYKFSKLEANYYKKDFLQFNSSAEYDFNFKILSKIDAYGMLEVNNKLSFNLRYNYKEPRIRYNSIFSVFDYGNTQEIEIGTSYKFSNFCRLRGSFANVEYKSSNAQRISLGASTKYGSINYRKTLGDAGELSSLSAYTAYSFLKGLITPSVGIAFTTYRLSTNSPSNNITSVLAGVNLRPWQKWSFDVQGQYSDNKIYKNDLRALLKINYWFNFNFKD